LTHYFVVVLVRKGSNGQGIKRRVWKLLKPYDEQLEVPEYERECFCVGMTCRDRAYDAARTRFGTTESREALEFAAETFDSDPEKSLPKADCEFCRGTGKDRSTLNPNGHWDWYSFGGRWDGVVNGDFSKCTPDYRSHTNRLEGNVSTPKFLLDNNIIPATIVTPDGQWHEEEDWKSWEWDNTAKSILSRNLETLAVGLDCHA
jgi:hypothetical protein